MRVVIDYNVVISAGLNPGTCRKVMNTIVWAHDFILSTEILTEYLAVSSRKKVSVAQCSLGQLICALSWNAYFVSRKPSPFILSDKSDQAYLDVALSGKADAVVTGNRRHFPEPVYDGVHRCQPWSNCVKSQAS